MGTDNTPHKLVENILGGTFGRLKVLAKDPDPLHPGRPYWICRCSCDRVRLTSVLAYDLIRGRTLSCGCLHRERAGAAQRTHGAGAGNASTDRKRTYTSWASMIQRCTNPKSTGFHQYGGAGVTVCARWRESFAAFLEDMGLRPEGTSIHRINHAKGYEPGNCRWATQTEQAEERKSSVMVEYNGEFVPLSRLAREHGHDPATVSARLRMGWTLEQALVIPIHSGQRPGVERTGRNHLTFKGETKSLAQWSRATGIHLQTLLYRMNEGWTPERTLTEPAAEHELRPVAGHRSIMAAAKAVGLKEATVRARLKKGWTVEDALNTPVMDPSDRSRGKYGRKPRRTKAQIEADAAAAAADKPVEAPILDLT